LQHGTQFEPIERTSARLPIITTSVDRANPTGSVARNIALPAFFIGFGDCVLLPGMALLGGGLPVRYFFGRKA